MFLVLTAQKCTVFIFFLFVVLFETVSSSINTAVVNQRRNKVPHNIETNFNYGARKITDEIESHESTANLTRYHRCRRGNYNTSQWTPSDRVSVPLVPIGWSEKWNSELVFLSDNEYVFCSNGPENLDRMIRMPAKVLKQTYEPGGDGHGCQYDDFVNQKLLRKCMSGLWIHMDGDSLSRDSYYDLLEVLGVQSECSRDKSQKDQVTVHALPDLQPTTISLAFNPAKRPICEKNSSWLQPNIIDKANKSHPDFWIWSPGLW